MNEGKHFSFDESLLLTHIKDHSQIYVLGIINNSTKDFGLEGTKLRDLETLKKFMAPGNIIVT